MVNSIGFGSVKQGFSNAGWTQVVTLERAADPQINVATAKGKDGKAVPAAGMTVDEILHGKKEKSHTLRNLFIGALAIATGAYFLAKHKCPKLTPENGKQFVKTAKDWGEQYVKFVDDGIKLIKDNAIKLKDRIFTPKAADNTGDAIQEAAETAVK